VIRVLIAEDETLVRAGIRTLLERQDGMTVVAEATDGEEALARLGYGIDVALLDVRMPRRGGISVLEVLRTWPSPPACLLLTTFDDREALLAGVRAGARGYLRKDVTIQTLARAIRVLAEGGTFFQPSLTEKLLRGVSRVAPLAAPEPVFMDPLTARETEVMRPGGRRVQQPRDRGGAERGGRPRSRSTSRASCPSSGSGTAFKRSCARWRAA
jgi:DNA-binding NarL/FixJ family response regulator